MAKPYTITQLIYRWDEILKSEAEAYSAHTDKTCYEWIAKAFPIPPKGCNEQTYLRARNRASFVFAWWRKRCQEAGAQSDIEQIEKDPFARAATLFELTNFLFSSDIVEPALFYFNSKGQITHEGMRSPSSAGVKDLKAILKRTKALSKGIAALAMDLGTLGFAAPPALKEISEISDSICRISIDAARKRSSGEIEILNIDAFETVNPTGTKARQYETSVNLLVFNLSEIYYRCLKFPRTKSYALLIYYLNSLTDQADPDHTPSLNVGALKKRKKAAQDQFDQQFSLNYQNIISRIPSHALSKSALHLRKALDCPDR